LRARAIDFIRYHYHFIRVAAMLDLGLLMYGGLLVLALWRCIFFYRCCGMWLSFLNYTSLLYVMLTASLVYGTVEFYRHTSESLITSVNSDADVWNVTWLRGWVLGSPAAVCLTVILCWIQTEGHVFEIHKDNGTLKHDRAVQIIALPSVFAVMAMASMVPIYELVTGTISTEMMTIPFGIDIKNRFGNWEANVSNKSDEEAWSRNLTLLEAPLHFVGQQALVHVWANATGNNQMTTSWDEALQYATWRYETCFYVGDLFEAWALYQFGLLALELIRESFAKQEMSENEGERMAAKELLAAHGAVSSLAWLGTMAFVLVCVGQTGCALYPYLVGSMEAGTSAGSQAIMMGFQVAGFIASGTAIYNVLIVETAFHKHLSPSSPVLKFLSVKILVSLSFFQKGVLVALQQGNKILPDMVQKIVAWVPVLGDVLNMTEVQLHLFYPALILYECCFTAVLHFWAWSSSEIWYLEGDIEPDPERQPLLKDAQPGDESPAQQTGYSAV